MPRDKKAEFVRMADYSLRYIGGEFVVCNVANVKQDILSNNKIAIRYVADMYNIVAGEHGHEGKIELGLRVISEIDEIESFDESYFDVLYRVVKKGSDEDYYYEFDIIDGCVEVLVLNK